MKLIEARETVTAVVELDLEEIKLLNRIIHSDVALDRSISLGELSEMRDMINGLYSKVCQEVED